MDDAYGPGLRRTAIILFSVVPLTASLVSFAKADVVSCVKQSNPVPAQIRETVLEIAAAAGLDGSSIKVVPCGSVQNGAWAFSPPAGAALPQGDYIFYNPTWVGDVLASDRTRAVTFFGHEFGHLARRHFGDRGSILMKAKETEADEFAGCAVARFGGDWNMLEDLLTDIRPANDSNPDYPSASTSLLAARTGFQRCGGAITPKSRELTNFIIFFDWDKASISTPALRVIRQAAEAYRGRGATHIAVKAFTDGLGTTLERVDRTRRQVSAIKQALVQEGIPAGSISIVAQDPRMAKQLVETAQGVREPQNRRAEIILY